ncbi:hypothetical protein [Flavobacterium nitrogenifigens]|uniref:PIN domain-containing protein n=1 Tax=Flavobacterium nitrogenifigens TaxID=1617283 RepID=A0A521D3W7_9FLAO|nr:hypothetical protein [Flavobacterium nitrogenifigens]KAF2332661.1 hypothetical protein DM397_10120 [Flavobacterium nitrogenifigens]SMO66393.1 hypothetical protein SAMN06265220_1021017 [Flavobacterium nitrogenifigens]
MKILIDTNIFLDFYRSSGTSIHVFSTLIENIDQFYNKKAISGKQKRLFRYNKLKGLFSLQNFLNFEDWS